MIVGGYVLDLYCDVEGCDAKLHVLASTVGPARNAARKAGWKVKVTADECYCPEHKKSSRERI